MANVLIIDDDEVLSRALVNLVAKSDHHAVAARTLTSGLERLADEAFDVVFLNVRMPDGDGLGILSEIRQAEGSPEVILITGADEPGGADLAVRHGAWDYLQKPLSTRQFLQPIQRVLQYRSHQALSGATLLSTLNRTGIVGNSPQIKACLESVRHAAQSESNVQITGEPGTGKGLIARALHSNSLRAGQDCVVVDCSLRPESSLDAMLFGSPNGESSLIKQADQGTLFLDGVCELPAAMQESLLHLLQGRRFQSSDDRGHRGGDLRLISSTDRDPMEAVAAGTFRKDLLYRLQILTIHVPPLRDRRGDIEELSTHFIAQLCRRLGLRPKKLSSDLMAILVSYNWPGNIRQLVDTLESTLNTARNERVLIPEHLPESLRHHETSNSIQNNKKTNGDRSATARAVQSSQAPRISVPYRAFRDALIAEGEVEYFHDLMITSKGNIKEACRLSGLGRTRLYTLLKKHNISRRSARAALAISYGQD